MLDRVAFRPVTVLPIGLCALGRARSTAALDSWRCRGRSAAARCTSRTSQNDLANTMRGRTQMTTRSLKLAVASLICLAAGAADAQEKKTLAIVVKGLDNPFFEQINLGCQKWQAENANSELYLPVHRSGLQRGRGRRGADRRRSAHQGRGGHRDLAVQRPGHGQPDPAACSDHPGDDDRRRFRRGGPVAAHDLPRHRQLPDGRQDGRARQAAEAGRRHRLPAARQRRGGQHQRARRRLPRHDRGHQGRGPARGTGRLDRDRRLPGVHQRPDRPRQPADGGHVHRQSRPRSASCWSVAGRSSGRRPTPRSPIRSWTS